MQAVTDMFITFSKGDQSIYNQLTAQAWQWMSAGCFVAHTVPFSLYTRSKYAPFVCTGSFCLLAGALYAAIACTHAARHTGRQPPQQQTPQ